MGKQRFIKPMVHRIDLTDGDWIEIKDRLTVGERKGILSKAARGGFSSDGQRVHLDATEAQFARVEAWLVDWSFKGLDDKPMKLSGTAIRALDNESFTEIEEALDKHEEAQAAAKNSSASTAPGSLTPTPPASSSGEILPFVTDFVGTTTT